jgi:hypothetical protein
MGSGKTLSMTYFAHKHYLKGIEIFANYGLLFPYKPIDYEKIKNLDVEFENAAVCIDEIHVFIDSRSSMTKVNRMVSYWITQSRKRNIKAFMYSTQHIGQVDKRLRDNTDYFVLCKRIIHHNKMYISMTLQNWEGKRKKLTLEAEKVFKLYDTRQIVNPFESSQD